MSEWICTKCGETAESKCPSQRNVFPTHHIATTISNNLGVSLLQSEFSSEIILAYTDYQKSKSIPEALEQILDMLQYAKENNFLAVISCEHHWVLNSKTETTCRLGGTHENLATYNKPLEKLNPHQALKDAFRLMLASVGRVAEELYDNETRSCLEQAKAVLYNSYKQYVSLIKNPDKATIWTVLWGQNKATFDRLSSAQAFLEKVPEGKLYSNERKR